MRRMFRLSDASHKDIDLREYEDEILEIADRIIPGKNRKEVTSFRLFEGKSVEEKEEEKDGRNTEMSVS